MWRQNDKRFKVKKTLNVILRYVGSSRPATWETPHPPPPSQKDKINRLRCPITRVGSPISCCLGHKPAVRKLPAVAGNLDPCQLQNLTSSARCCGHKSEGLISYFYDHITPVKVSSKYAWFIKRLISGALTVREVGNDSVCFLTSVLQECGLNDSV